MGVKVIGEVEAIPHFEWKIPNYFSQASTVADNQYVHSPSFSYFESTWKLRLYPGGNNKSGWISLFLVKEDPDHFYLTSSRPAFEKLSITLDVKKSDDTLQETFNKNCNGFFTKQRNAWGFQSFLKIAELQKYKSVFAPLGTVTFTCWLEKENATSALYTAQKKSQESAGCIGVISELEALSSDLSQFFVSKEKCDVIVRMQDKEFQAHRTVLMARSPVFRAMFMHDTKEAREGVVNEPDCDPESFESFLQYMYTGRLKDIQFRDAHQLYVTSDKYDVQTLKSSCVTYMVQNLTAENFCEISALGDLFDDVQLASATETFFIENFRKIFLTDKWSQLLMTNYQLVDRLLKKI